MAPPTAAEVACHVPGELKGIRQEHLVKLNAIRRRQEVEALIPSAKLDEIAQTYACVLARSGHFDHIGPRGSTLSQRVEKSGYTFCVIAENLAKGQRTITEALQGWVTSPGHWRNMKGPGVTEIGLGVAAPVLSVTKKKAPGGLSTLAFELTGKHPKVSGDLPNFRHGPIVWVQVFGHPC